MRSFIKLLPAMALMTSNIFYAGSIDTTGTFPFGAGSKSIQFQVGPSFSLRSFQGSLISFQKHTAPERAVRLGISVNGKYNQYAGTRNEMDYNSGASQGDTLNYTVNSVKDNISLGFVAQFMKYSGLRNNMLFYSGLGPTASFQHSRYDYTLTPKDTAGINIVNDRTDDTVYLGMSGVFGIEWFFMESMSLLFEYDSTISAGYNQVERVSERTHPSGSFDKLKEITSGPVLKYSSGVKFGLSIHFDLL